jgi:signal transduction histidine kinase
LSASLRHEQRFSAEIAHELRTPLAALRAETELALAHDLSEGETRESLGTVLRHADRMTAVIETLLVAAERDADSRRGTVDAREAAVAARETCDTLAAERGVTLDVNGSNAPIEVDADRQLTTQILVPIVENAVRYGRSRVRLDIARDGGTVRFTVEDDGPGVAVDELDAVFEPGMRGTAAAGSSGAGLGLPLARRLARLAGGEVEAVGDSGGGRFVVRLPAS